MSRTKYNTSLLGTLSSAQIDALIHEEEMRQSGYDFYYAIDADDLGNYAYPLGLKGDRPDLHGISYELITHEQISLFSLFGESKFKVFLFTEHLDEVSQLINKIKLFQSEGTRIIDTVRGLVERLNQDTGKDISQIRSEVELVQKNILLILSIAVGLQADGVDKLYQLRKNKKILFSENEFFQNLFEMDVRIQFEDFENRTSKLTEIIYDGIREHPDENRNDLVVFRKNVSYYRDSLAIGKVFSINSRLHREGLKKILLYLSSDSKTKNLFYKKRHSYDGIVNTLQEQSIIYRDLPVNYHRNSAQIFLRLLCEENSSDTVIENLKLVRSIVELRELRETDQSMEGKKLIVEPLGLEEFFRSKIEANRRKFEGYSTMIRIDKFKNLSDSLKNLPKGDATLGQIVQILEKLIIDQHNKDTLENWRNSAEDGLKELSQLNAFRSTIFLYSVARLDRVIREHMFRDVIESLDTGQDYIFGEDHHLPIYFTDEAEEVEPRFARIVDHYKDTSRDLRSFVSDLATKLFAITKHSDEVILKRCLLLLLLSNSKFFGTRVSNYIETFLSDYQFETSEHSSNFYYLLVWVMRRNGHYESAIQKSIVASEEFHDDPRFYHSLCLSYYCLYEDSKETEISYLEKSLSNANTSIFLYNNRLIGILESKGNRRYITQSIFGLMNTKIYLLAVGFAHDNNKFPTESIKQARDILNQLKVDDPSYYNKPEFLHTEAYLELQEYKIDKDPHKLAFAKFALEQALKKVRQSSKLEQLCTDLMLAIENLTI